MLEPGAASYPILRASALLLLLAAAADVLDGAIARLMHAESEFGIIFDSLADAITFGVAPAVMMIKSLNLPGEEHRLALIAATSAMIYAICGVLRLARYSAKKSLSPAPLLEETWQRVAKYHIFVGLPIPAAAGAAVSAMLFLISPEIRELFSIEDTTRSIISICVMLILGYLMISRWRFPGINAFFLRVQSGLLIFATVVLSIVLFYGILYYFPVVFVVLAWGYLLTAWIIAIIHCITGRKPPGGIK